MRGNTEGLAQMTRRLSSLPRFWRVFGTNAVALTLAAAALVLAPVTVSAPISVSELLVLLAGLLVLPVLNLLLLRPAFEPLGELADTRTRASC